MRTFLKDVFICSLGAYGVFMEEELVELIALTTILPGPSSTQTIVAIGYKVGGPLEGDIRNKGFIKRYYSGCCGDFDAEEWVYIR